jgi:hypothetical protein
MRKSTTFGHNSDLLNRLLDRDPDHALSKPTIAVRELDRRHNDGTDVQLLWEPQTDRVVLALTDDRSGESVSFEVDPGEALTAFHHPYAYTGQELTWSRR